MRYTYLVRSLSVLVAVGLLFVAGCTEATIGLSGKLVSSKLKLQENDAVIVQFAPQAETGKPATAKFSTSDQTFTVKGLTPGKYKITLRVTPYSGDKKRAPLFEPFNAKYDSKSTPLSWDVTSESNQSITVDLESGKVTKG